MKLIKIKKGFSLIEVLISSTILIVVITALVATIISMLRVTKQTNDMVVANQIIKSILETSIYSSSAVSSAKPSDFLSSLEKEDKYYSIDILKNDDPSGAKKFQVIVFKGRRSGANFYDKRFLSQSVKYIAE